MATTHYFADFAAMRSQQASPANGDLAVVAKRYSADPNNDGGGTFIYDANLGGDDDAAIVIKRGLETGNARWKRQVDVRGPIRAEWFGAKGDGTTNDKGAIDNCLTRYGRVDLMAKTYAVPVYGIALGSNYRIEGQGIDRTTVKVINDPPADTVGHCYGLATAAGYTSDNVVIRELTVDCNFRSFPNAYGTRMAIKLDGAFNLVERVKAKDFGAGRSGHECFVIALRLSAQNTPASQNHLQGTIRDCVITEPGNNGAVQYTGGIPEITCLTMGGYSNSNLAVGGRIVGNKIHHLKYDPNSQRSALHGITIGTCSETEVIGNEIINFDGIAVFWMSWKNENVLVRQNRMINVNMGVGVSILGTPPNLSDDPYHFGTRIEENLILLGRLNQVQSALRGVYLYITSGFASGSVGIRLKDITVRGNFIQGARDGSNVPTGILLFLNSAIFENLAIEDNVIETPDYGNTWDFSVPHENAVVFIPYWPYDSAKVKVHGNRNLLGTDLRLKIVSGAGESGTWYSLWGPFSSRLARFKAPMFDDRSGLAYDEFTGQAPSFTLGWAASLSWAGAGVTAEPGQAGRPGIAKLATGTTSAGSAALKHADNAVVLLGGASHVLEFATKRSQSSGGQDTFECRMGLMQPSGNTGVYSKIDNANEWKGVCNNGAGETVLATNLFDWGGQWTKLKIEVVVTTPAPEARFYVNDVFRGRSAANLPTAGLHFAFKISKLTGTNDRSLLVDYFQHQLY